MIKKLKLLILFFKAINSYGVINSTKIIFFELVELLTFKDSKSLDFEDNKTSSYKQSKKSKKYDVPYIPTPYFFLKIIKNYLHLVNLKKINFIDIGCGYCRPAKYLSRNFNVKFFGVDLDKNIVDQIRLEKNKNFKIYNFNIRNKKKINFFLEKNLKTKLCNIILISDTVEIQLINQLLNSINSKSRIIIILVNINYNKLKVKGFFVKKKIFFKNKSKNIIFLENNFK